MDGLQQLKAERDRLLEQIDQLTRPVAPYSPPRVEDVWRRLRMAVSTLRVALLPHMRAVAEIIGPTLTEGVGAEDDAIAAVAVLNDEISRELADLAEIEQVLVRDGLSPQRLLDAMRAVGGVRSLAIAALRLIDEVIVPRLRDAATAHEIESLAEAVLAYEHTLGEAS